GPDLTGVGDRFSRIHLVESILEPSRTIAPSYQAFSLILADGRSLTGVKLAETGEQLTLGDAEGKQHVLARSQIEAEESQTISIMPQDLAKSLTVDEFVDLIAFLAGEKEERSHD
ncbi:MAG: hypothetical protein WD403_02615, partial [Pirellulales bacterium]